MKAVFLDIKNIQYFMKNENFLKLGLIKGLRPTWKTNTNDLEEYLGFKKRAPLLSRYLEHLTTY